MEPSQSRSRSRKPRIGIAEIVGDGVFAGLIGASAVALWFLVIDAALREPFYTPSLVGTALLRGQPPSADHAVDLTMVAAFTAIHSSLFLLFGIAASWVVAQFQRTPDLPLITIGTFIVLEGGFVIATKLFVPDLAETIGHGLIVAGNVFAAIGMGLWLRGLQRHPEDLAAATPR